MPHPVGVWCSWCRDRTAIQPLKASELLGPDKELMSTTLERCMADIGCANALKSSSTSQNFLPVAHGFFVGTILDVGSGGAFPDIS